MKTISKRKGKNYEIEVKGDLHKYPDGSVHTVKEGKAVWGEGGGSGGAGYSVEKTMRALVDEPVTGDGPYHEAYTDYVAMTAPLVADSIVVTYNGTKYEVEKREGVLDSDVALYGAGVDEEEETYDFSEYPFLISVSNPHALQCYVVMSTQGPNDVKIEVTESDVTPTDDFKAAVEETVGRKDYTIKERKGDELFTETVTEFQLSSTYYYLADLQAEPITSEWVVINLNGEEFLCRKHFLNGEGCYGEDTSYRPTFTTYPFGLLISGETMKLLVPDNKEYTIAVYAAYPTAVPTDTFAFVVDSFVNKQELYGDPVAADEFNVFHEMTQQEFLGLMRRGGTISVNQYIDDSYSSTVSLHLLGYYVSDDPDDAENSSYLLVGNGDGNVYKGILDPTYDGETRFVLQT